MPAIRIHERFSFILCWFVLVLAVLLGISCSIAAFFGSAFFASSVVVLSITGILVGLLVSFGLARLAAIRIATAHPNRFAIPVSVGTVVLAILLSVFTIFNPLEPLTDEMEQSQTMPLQANYWDLPTGSHIAYLKIPAKDVSSTIPIIVIHGGPGYFIVTQKPTTDIFSKFAQYGYDVYCYDQIGSGLSARLDDISEYTLSRHVSDLKAIRQKIGAEKVILTGESFGTRLIANYLAKYPGHAYKCILISPGRLNPEEWEDIDVGNIADRLPEEQQHNSIFKPRFIAAIILSVINPKAAYNFIPQSEINPFFASIVYLSKEGAVCGPNNIPKGISWNGFGFWANIITLNHSKANAQKLAETLKTNQTPLLILRGTCDYLIGDVAYQYKSIFPNSVMLSVEDARHIIYWDKPDLFLEAVRAFLLDEPLPLLPYADKPPLKKDGF